MTTDLIELTVRLVCPVNPTCGWKGPWIEPGDDPDGGTIELYGHLYVSHPEIAPSSMYKTWETKKP